MTRKFLLLVAVLAAASQSAVMGQSQKWAQDARSAVFTLMTYDAQGTLLGSGNGFFIAQDGTAVSEYSLFKGAQRAVAVDVQGQQMDVTEVIGANDLYDFIKFRVDVSRLKKPAFLEVRPEAVSAGERLLLVPYSTQKKFQLSEVTVSDAARISGSYQYYTLSTDANEKMASCPLVDESGKVVAMMQMSSSQDKGVGYAVDVRYPSSLEISVMAFSDALLGTVGIEKAIPDDQEKALAMLYMASSMLPSEAYNRLLDRYVSKFPDSQEGYMRRATFLIGISTDSETMGRVIADLDRAEKLDSGNAGFYYLKASLMLAFVQNARPGSAAQGWNLEEAEKLADKAILLSDEPFNYKLKGDIRFARKDYAAALETYEKVNSTKDRSAATFYSAARCKELLEDYSGALALMDSCMTTFTYPFTQEGAAYLYEHARLCTLAGNHRQAFNDYNLYENLSSVAKEAGFYFDRALAALQLRAFQVALDDLSRAVEMDPQEVAYRAQLAAVHLRVGQNSQALSVLEEAMKMDPSNGELFRLRGLTHMQMKDKQKACEDFHSALEKGDAQAQQLIDKYCE